MFRRRVQSQPMPDQPLFVVGDLHGRSDLLDLMLDRVPEDALPIFVGDYVDRGPDSKGVLTRLQQIDRPAVFLKGNHEEMMLTFLADPVAGERWLMHGGAETAESFGVTRASRDGDPQSLAAIATELRAAIGQATLTFLQGLALSHQSGNVFVSHAGAEPALPLDAQPEQALIWGAPSARKKPRRDGAWVVHGHYASSSTIEEGRVNTDSGAYFSDRLTAAHVRDGSVDLVTVEP